MRFLSSDTGANTAERVPITTLTAPKRALRNDSKFSDLACAESTQA